MGESAIPEARTILLVGKSGNGKSATGNSIIGEEVFDTMPSSAGVTATCQLHKTVLDNGQILNVIDTPGLFDTSVEPGIIRNEIAKCFKMAKNGIHAFLVVLSVRSLFSQEAFVIEMLKQFFGGEICEYMIVVFAHGDALGEMSLADYFGGIPEPLRKILEMCGKRFVLFDNVTVDQLKKSRQQKELLHLVDVVVLNNGGISYSNELFVGSHEAYEELHLKKIESRLRETTLRVEKQLADEQLARKQAEAMVLEAQLKSIAEFNRLSEISRRDLGVLRNTQIESEKKFKEVQERLEQGIQMELEIAQRETEMLIKRRRESEQKLNEFNAEQRRLQAESWEISKSNKAYKVQLLDMDSNHREKTLRLEKQLEVEQVARLQAEAAQMKSNDEISKVRGDLERAQSEARVLQETHSETPELLNKLIREKGEENLKKINNCAISEIASAIEHKIESKLRETTLRLEKQLEDEQVARMQAEAAQMKSNDDISKLREDLERARREARVLQETHRETQELLNKLIQEKKDEENQKKTNNCAFSEITSAIEHKIESKLRETSLQLEIQLAEKFARMQAEDKAQLEKSNDEIRKLREDMERAERYTDYTFKKIQIRLGEENQEKSDCSVSEIALEMEDQFESILYERVLRFGKLLANEKVAHQLLAEEKTQQAEKKTNVEISKVREDLESDQMTKRRKTPSGY